MRSLPKVFFFSLVVFLLSSLALLSGQPNSKSGLKEAEKDVAGWLDPTFAGSYHFQARGFEPHLNQSSEHRSIMRDVPPPSVSESSVSPVEQKAIMTLEDDFRVNDDMAGECDQGGSNIARDPSGSFVIVWQDSRHGNKDIYAQRYDASATPLGINFRVNNPGGTGDYFPRYPGVAADASGNFVIIWVDDRNWIPDIYAQRYDFSGNPLGANFRVNEEAGTNNQMCPSIAMDATGNFVVTWTEEGEGYWYIYARRFDSSGTPLGSNFKVDDDTSTEFVYHQWSRVAIDSVGNFVVAWEDKRSGTYDVYAQRYNSSGLPIDSNFKVNDESGIIEAGFPDVALDGSGRFVVTWQDARNSGQYLHWDIYAQRYDSLGSPQGSNFKVNDDTGTGVHWQITPAIAMDVSGNFVITWEDHRNGPSSDIYAQRYDFSGTPLDSNFKVHDGSEFSGYGPAIAMDGSGNFLISWDDCRNHDYDVFGQRYDSAGTPIGLNFKVNDDVSALQGLPAIALDGSGNFVITWGDSRNFDLDIYAQRYDSSANPLGSNFKVNSEVGMDQGDPAIAMSPPGNFVITWVDDRNGNWDIYAQRYNSSGTPLSLNFRVNDDDMETNIQTSPAIAMDESGNFVITWDDSRGASGPDIYAQRYDHSGTPLGSNFKVNDDVGAFTQASPAIAMDNPGTFVITWGDKRNDSVSIYAQRYDFSGNPLGSNFKVNEEVGLFVAPLFPAIAMDGYGNFVIAWEDVRNANRDVYAQRYDTSGNRLGPNFKVNADVGNSEQSGVAIAMDDFGKFVVIWQDVRNGNFDIYAQKYTASGDPLDTNFLVPNPQYASFEQMAPAVTASGYKIYCTWQDDRGAKGYDIYAKILGWIWPSVCGDVNADGMVDVADVIHLINYLFREGPAPSEHADVNTDGIIDIGDVIYLINYLFKDGPEPCSQ